MSNHMTEWLNAYLDGELKGRRLHQVEEHLAECDFCRAELESLQNISMILREVPAPEFISSERFAAQVNLRLPHELPKASKRNVQEAGWWLIPVGLVVIWIFINTTAMVSEVLLTAGRLGLLNDFPAWLVPGSSSGAIWSGALGQLGILSGNGLGWAETTEAITRSTLPQLIWQVSIALLYLGWIAIWWARQMRQGHDQPLES